ncbi:glycoside hydrolase family 28 protein [Sphingobacterium bambusae]|uniref:Glycoside hydrolase family 28 protein n=1 Tax=Sphingobacterium bambusae TaxID=662858 RepID=A0ABW6BDX3_9SPHI|nr:glycoside hydrolase family 28 protein [Sphingobacterium bambusae]WPL50619.1 glycoside hydrolase family 28 protein [Sphingobacterium bambusae]
MRIVHAICFLLLLALFYGCKSVPLERQLDGSLRKADQVGADQLPIAIEPVHSPFFMQDFARPTFPDRRDTVVAGEQDIQQKIDRLAQAGGGILLLQAGHHRSGRIQLKSNINLHVEKGAVLEFNSEIADFLPVVFTRNEGVELYSLGACIYANGAKNIAITGSGKLIGPGAGTVREKTMTHDVIENIVDSKTPVENRIYDGKTADFIFPPALIAPINCQDVWIEGLHLERSAFWNVVPTYCERVVIRGLTIQSVGIQRGDGIDIESSKDVLVEYCTLHTGDDCIAIKAGRGYDGLRVNRPSENIVVRYCLSAEGHGGFTIGSETAGMVKKVYVHDCVFTGTDVGIRFKTRRPRGGGGEKIRFENIRMDVQHSALRWDMLGQALHVGQQASRDFKVEKNILTPHFSSIELKNIYIGSSSDCIKVEGIPESPLEGVRFDRIFGRGTRYLSLRDAQNILINDSKFICEELEVDSIGVVGLEQKNVTLITKK